jgi:hypothetical protein
MQDPACMRSFDFRATDSPLHTNMQMHYSSQYNYTGRSQTGTSP